MIKTDILSRLKADLPDEIYFAFKWTEFNSMKHEKFDINTSLVLEFGNYRYKIITESQTLFKDYSDKITLDEINDITNRICKLILGKIKLMIK